MNHSYIRSLVFVLTVIALSGLPFVSLGLAQKSTAQDQTKSMNIERYPNEPLELVDLRIGSKSIKSAIETKVSPNAEGLDKVKFTAPPDWHKSVSVTLKNVSGKPVIGVMAHLFYETAESGEMFQMQLEQGRNLQKEPLAPGAEVSLVVGTRLWGAMTTIIEQKGADPDLAKVTLSVDAVMFTKDSQWYRGRMMRSDPASPDTWRPVETPRGSE